MRKAGLICAALVLTALGSLFPGGASADGPYKITVGDRLMVAVNDTLSPDAVLVDLDGKVPVPFVGRVAVVGLDLDAAGAHISDVSETAGVYVDPIVIVSIAQYAPVFVLGDVRRAGQVPFAPGMTVAAAAAGAGGLGLIDDDSTTLALLAEDLASDMVSLRSERAQLLARQARLTEQLQRAAQPDGFLLDGTPDAVASDQPSIEGRIQSVDAQSAAALAQIWDRGVAEAQKRITLLNERVKVQTRILESRQEELADIQAFVDRGLRPANDLPRFQRLATEAESQLLELEATQSEVLQKIIDLEEERTRFLRSRQLLWSEELADTALRLARLDARLQATQAKAQLLGQSSDTGVDVSVRYVLDRNGATPGQRVSPSDPMRPGDILHVEAIYEAPDAPF